MTVVSQMKKFLKRYCLVVMMAIGLTGVVRAQSADEPLPAPPVVAAGQQAPPLDSALFITDLVSVVREKTKVLLNWKVLNMSPEDYVAVERNSNGREYEVVAVLRQSTSGQWYEWIDDAPARGKNLYRIKVAGKSGPEQYSKATTVLITGDISFRFYPNPVDNILIIRSEAPMDIQIIDASGKQRLAQDKLQGLQTLNVSALEKGLYLLHTTNRVTGTVTQEKLLKN